MIIDGIEAAFQSKRLVYRAAENNDHDKHFLDTQIENDPIIAALGSSRVLKPGGLKEVDQLINGLLQSTLGVIVCLPECSFIGETNGETTRQDNRGALNPIGFVVLGWGSKPGDQMLHRSISVGISLAAPYQNQGYGGEAISWALDWAFRFGGYHRVSISAYSFNERAQHLYKRLGFVEEGRSREAHWHDRKWYDVVNFGMLEQEWEMLRGCEGTTA